MSTNIPSPPELGERAQALLKALIERYIVSGQPVGSRTLARDAGLDISPATVRNTMADLEEMGFLETPHAGAGRVPTARGYRLFVDCLMQLQPLDSREVEVLRRYLKPDQAPGELVQSVSALLSSATRLAGVVMVPRNQLLTLRHVEFLPLNAKRVLVILVVNEQEVQNRIIHTERSYSAAELQQAANYLNAEFAGQDIQAVRQGLLGDMSRTRESLNHRMAAAVEMADKAFGVTPGEGEDYVVAGQTNLMGLAELTDMDKLRDLFDAFHRKRDILHLFDQCLNAQGVQLFIGEESGFSVFDDCTVVTAPYSEGQVMGVLGVIGPTRMSYDRVIPIVEVTAKLLAAALNSRN